MIKILKKAVFLLLIPCTFFAQTSSTPSLEPTWYNPPSYQWAIQKYDPSTRKLPSVSFRTLIAEGTGESSTLDWKLFTPNSNWKTAKIFLYTTPSSTAFYGQTFSNHDLLAIPPLPLGSYWLEVKTYGENGRLISSVKHYLNIVESSVSSLPPSKLSPTIELKKDGKNLVVQFPADSGLSLKIDIKSINGDMLETKGVAIESPSQSTVSIPISQIIPGKTITVTVSLLKNDFSVDQSEIWLSEPGDFPATPSWPKMGKVSVPEDTPSETMISMPPFSSQKEGLEKQIAGMKDRQIGMFHLSVRWSETEIMSGARDWSTMDEYVQFLTEKKIPFSIEHIGSVLFGNGPVEMWGDWMVNHRRDFKLWRNLPAVSPNSKAYRKAATDFLRHIILRYRDNPYLVGYEFVNQGMDSGVFMDRFDSFTDYSASARKAFQSMLQSRYKTLNTLNAAWDSKWTSWESVLPPMPNLECEADLSKPWLDWTDFKLETYKKANLDLYDPVVLELDPGKLITHYVAKTGPFEYLFPYIKNKFWHNADGAGEDRRMVRINSLTRNWNIWRQTESHDVPPANKRYMMDIASQAMLIGENKIRFNHCWNSMGSYFATKYPSNKELSESMDWWTSQFLPIRETVTSCQVFPKIGLILSWSDMLYRIRVWRWYAIPGDRAEALANSQSLLPVKWLSDYSPDAAWDDLPYIVASQDALVWSPQLIEKLEKFVSQGGHLIVWGRSGQYTPGESTPFSWIKKLGGSDISITSVFATTGKQSSYGLLEQKPSLSETKKVSLAKMEWNNQTYNVSPAVLLSVSNPKISVISDSESHPIVLKWNYGKGSVTWCATDTENESEKLIVSTLKDLGYQQEAVSSNPSIYTVVLHGKNTDYLVASRFLGYGAKAENAPIEGTIRLPQVKGDCTLRRILPAEKEGQKISEKDLTETGIPISLLPSEVHVYELKSTRKWWPF